MITKRNIFFLLILVFLSVQNALAIEEISLKTTREKDITGTNVTAIGYLVKDLNFTGEDMYLLIRADSLDGNTYAKIYLSMTELPDDRSKAELFAVEDRSGSEDKRNLLFLSKTFSGTKTNFYIWIECNAKVNVKLTFNYSNYVPIYFQNDYRFISAPKKLMNDDLFQMEIPKELFPVVLYVVSPNDIAIYESQVTVTCKETVDVVLQEFDGGLIAVLNSSEILEGEGSRILHFMVTSSPNSLVTIGARRQSQDAVYIQPGHKMIYSKIESKDYEECFDFINPSIAATYYTLSVIPFRKNLKIYEKGGKTYADDLDYHKSFQFTFGGMENKKTFCFRTSTADETVYGFQIENFPVDVNSNALKEPLYHGILYDLSINKNDIVYYRHYRREFLFEAVTNMNVDLKKGNIKVFKIKCTTFPNCEFTDANLTNPVHEVNGFYQTSYNIYKEPSLFSSEQNLLVVKCLSDTCDYEVSFYSDSDIMELKEGQRFSQFMLTTQTEDYKIRNEKKETTKIIVNLIPISGDTFITMMPNPFVEFKYLYIGTNTIVEITADPAFAHLNPLVDEFDFIIRATANAYYSVSYENLSEDLKSKVQVTPGIYSMETMPIQRGAKTTFTMTNRKVEDNEPYLTTFFPMNCDVKINRNGKNIPEVDGIFQEIITSTDSEYKSGKYPYEVTLVNMEEKATFTGERCVLYIASKEGSSKIVLGEGQFIQFQLTKTLPSVTYLIPHINLQKNLLTNFVIENEIGLEISVNAEGQGLGGKMLTKRNMPFIITPPDLRYICKEGVCNIEYTVKIKNTEEIDNNRNVRFDFIGRTENTTPSYLKKRLLREETVATDAPYYFITDIGKNEEGEIVLNYNKGSGVLAARIVAKNTTDDLPVWGGRYELPDPYSGNSLKYDPFTQSISYSSNETNKCDEGCDLLIGVFTTETFRQEEYVNTEYFEDFSIFVKSTQKEDEMGGIVDIPVNEFVQGHLEKLNTGVNKKDAYTLTIHNDCEKLFLEIQGELVDIYINFDKPTLPTGKEDAQYSCENMGTDTICEITASFGNFRGHMLSFIVMSQIKESAGEFNAYYLFKFRAPHTLWAGYNIYELNSDHGVKCNVAQSGYCNFLFPVRNYQIYNVLYFYVEGEILSEFKMYANDVDANEFEAAQIQDIENFIPKEGRSQYNTTDSFHKNMLVLDEQMPDDFVLVSVFSERKTTLTLMMTYKENIKSTLPKPHSSQIYKVEVEGDDSSMILSLPSDRDYEMFIQSAVGSMLIYSRDEDRKTFRIKGNGDSVLITFNENENPEIITFIEVTALEDDSIFYVDYRPRNKNDNFDKLKFGSSSEISYDDIGFPVTFYSKIPDNIQEKDYVVNVRYKGEHNMFTDQRIDNFEVKATIVDYKFIQKRLRDKTKRPTTFTDGIFNPFLRSGVISIQSDESFEDSNEGSTFVYVEMNNTKDNPKKNYTDIHLEVSILPLNEKKNLSPDGVYNHAFLLDNQPECNLHTIKRRFPEEHCLQLEFSTISKDIEYAIIKYSDSVKDSEARQSDPDIMKYLKTNITTGGKITLLFEFEKDENENYFPEKIILSVFHKTGTGFKRESTAYVYRFQTDRYLLTPNQVKEDQTKYTYYENGVMLIRSSQPTIYIEDMDDVVIPADYYIMLLPGTFKDNTQSIAIRKMEYNSLMFYDTDDNRKYLRVRIDKYPKESDTMTMFAIADALDDLFAYSVVNEVTKDPQKDTDYIELKMENETLEYSVEDNDDQYVFFFKINVPKLGEMQPFFDIRVKSKDNVTENDLFFSATKLYPNRENADLISDERLNDAIFVSKELISNTKTIFLSVVCENICNFRMQIDNAVGVSMSPGDHVRHLFRGDNIHLPVIITERQEIKKDNDNKFITIFAFGGDGVFNPNLAYTPSLNSTFNAENIKMNKFYNGYVVTLDSSKYPLDNDAFFKLDVFAQSGLIAVAVRYTNDFENNKYKIFDNEIRGWLIPQNIKECFVIDGYYSLNNEIEATILTNTKVRVYLEKKDTSEKIEGTEHTVEYQNSYVYVYDEPSKICFERLSDDFSGGTGFAFQLIQNSDFESEDSAKIASKVNGVIYKQNLDNKLITYYRHSKYKSLEKNDEEENTINFNLKIIEGDPKFYIHHCTNFPYCKYTPETIREYLLDGSMTAPPKLGDFYIGSINTAQEKHELSLDQYVIVVSCINSPIDCSYEVSFYDEKDRLMLRPDESFNQYMISDDEDKFTFTINDINVKEIELKLSLLSGSAYINNLKMIDGNIDTTTKDIGNNQIKKITQKEGKLRGVFEFEVLADINAYYMITVYPIIDKDNGETILPRSTVVLESFPSDKPKIISFNHYYRTGELGLWSAKFYSLNCKLNIAVLNEEMKEAIKVNCTDNYCQNDISMDSDPDIFVMQRIKYKVSSSEIYGDDGESICKFYVATQEKTTDDQLVYAMNAPFRLFFDKNFPRTRLVYPFANIEDHLIMNLVLEDESHLNITVRVPSAFDRRRPPLGIYTTMKSRAIATQGFRRECPNKEEPCIVEYTISAMNKEEIETGFVMDLSIKNTATVPSYLQRRKVREEFSYVDNIQYYVSEVGDNEKGTVQLHFNRGKGTMFAKIVPKNKIEENPNYRGRVALPQLGDAPLKMDEFTYQIKYDTSKYSCAESHCEIYIGVYDTQEYVGQEKNMYLNDFSIFIKGDKDDSTKRNSVVDVPINEYITGSLTETRDKGVYDYYTFNVPVDVKQFTIEFYTEAVDLYINEGLDIPPTDKKHKYKLETDGGPGMLTIKSEDDTSLKGKIYYLGIGSDKIDQIISARYKFRIIAIERGISFNQELNSDEAILSKVVDDDPEKENNYGHYILPIRDYDRAGREMDMYLYTYSRTVNDLEIYVRLITEDEYATMSDEDKKTMWPTDSYYDIGTEAQLNKDYLYIPHSYFRR
ncbi:MAG: hypothetical protein MJ252_01725, partial [archaeon]|nr:hypothetical protein [archaeon]